jgi:hypothetical protein
MRRCLLALEVIVLALVFLLAGIIAYDGYGSAAGPTITTVTTTATVTAIPRAVPVAVVYGVAANAAGVMVFTRDGDLMYGYYNGTHYTVFDLTKNSVVRSFACSAKTIVAGYHTGYVVCDSSVYDVYLGSRVYYLPDVPSFLVYDYYSDRVLAFINSYPAMATVVVFDASGRTIYSGTWTNFMVYGAASSGDSYYLIMYNAATGWWLARFDKGFSRVLANISIPAPMNNNVDAAKYSAFAANDFGVLLISGDGSAVVYDRDLKPLFTVSGSYTRAAASKYHFYLMDSSGSIYVAGASGVVYIYGVAGDVHYARVSKEFWDSDKGIAYDPSGCIYILDPPSDLVFLTTTSTVYIPYYVTRTATVTETTTVYGFAPSAVQVALFIALLVLAIGIYYFLKKR